jgi:hypothetical protein
LREIHRRLIVLRPLVSSSDAPFARASSALSGQTVSPRVLLNGSMAQFDYAPLANRLRSFVESLPTPPYSHR